MRGITDRARKASCALSVLSADRKNSALEAMAKALEASRDEIKKANSIDLEEAERSGKNKAFLDRLKLDDRRVDGMISMFRDVKELDDPVGAVMEEIKRPNGLVIQKIRVPIGVIGIIYESRPNVTADCVSLCLKSGNAVILRGGSDAINSNKAVFYALKDASVKAGIDEGAFILVEDTSRQLVEAMLKASGGIDLIMPRGGESLIRSVSENSRVPVIKHYKGLCHIYVDESADLDMAEEICFNAKVQRPGVCNAMETMLVNSRIAEEFLPRIAGRLSSAGVVLKGCPETRKIVENSEEAGEKEFSTEWLDLVLSVRVVDSMEQAIEHIEKFGSHHSDAIITEDERRASEFVKRVDSSSVYVNASTRFTDGGEFGKGAEIGISTDKLHARGPMGLEELCTYKYVVRGTGQIRK
ncbi:MAG: glutamate-5-semialdehyde dehydrogenase [Candidatus Omnitrophica bacterium]|nr:glutamate-5-semialdehyde dehydrogenase [Candidatus Omnitrophota bacterium]